MAFLKHVGRHSGTGQRLAVVFLQLPDDKEYALVAYSDSLPDRYHDSLMDAIESPEGQAARNLYEVLTRKVFWHGKPMLDTLHREGLLKKLPTASIVMTPNSNTNVPLNDILAQLESFENEGSVQPIKEESIAQIASDDANLVPTNDDNSKIAQNLMIQAQLLEQDAIAKREEAYRYDPSLRPSATTTKVRVTGEKSVETQTKRGRPKKSEA